MSFISVIVEKRNGKLVLEQELISIKRIATPIRKEGGAKSVITLNESIYNGRGSENLVLEEYTVTGSIDDITSLSPLLFSANVLTRNGNKPSDNYNKLGFSTERIVGPIMSENSGSKFMYYEDNTSLPVEFVVSDTITAINNQLIVFNTSLNAVKQISVDYTALEDDKVLEVTDNLTINLYNAEIISNFGKSFGSYLIIKNGLTTVTRIEAAAGETIDGSSFIEITQPLASVTLQVSENGKWIII